jgi:hypothetical protein
MTKINLKGKVITNTADWCAKFISPRKYWLHNRMGGEGWYIEWEDKLVLTIEDEKTAILVLTIEDEKTAILAILKFGDQL